MNDVTHSGKANQSRKASESTALIGDVLKKLDGRSFDDRLLFPPCLRVCLRWDSAAAPLHSSYHTRHHTLLTTQMNLGNWFLFEEICVFLSENWKEKPYLNVVLIILLCCVECVVIPVTCSQAPSASSGCFQAHCDDQRDDEADSGRGRLTCRGDGVPSRCPSSACPSFT